MGSRAWLVDSAVKARRVKDGFMVGMREMAMMREKKKQDK